MYISATVLWSALVARSIHSGRGSATPRVTTSGRAAVGCAGGVTRPLPACDAWTSWTIPWASVSSSPSRSTYAWYSATETTRTQPRICEKAVPEKIVELPA